MNPVKGDPASNKKTPSETPKPSQEEKDKPELKKEDKYSGEVEQLDDLIHQMRELGFGK
jgi:hypothetical protein